LRRRPQNKEISLLNGTLPKVCCVGIYRVSSLDRTPKDTAHKQITYQYTSIFDVVKTLKEGNSSWPEPMWPLQAIY